MDKTDFSERFLLLRNGACCGIIKQQSWESNMLIVLSPSGSVIDIYYEGNNYKGKTKFTRTSFQSAIQRILSFRNAFAVQPFHCKRFTQQSPLSTDAVSTWHLCPSLPNPSSTDLYLCPLSRRILAVTDQYIAEDDNCIEYPIKGPDVAYSYPTRSYKLYPLHRLPRNIEALIHEAASESASIKAAVHTIAPNSNTGITCVLSDTNVETMDLLTGLMAHMSLLARDSDVYPAATTQSNNTSTSDVLSEAGMVTLVEHLDGDTFLVSNSPREVVSPNDFNRHNKLLQSLHRVQQKIQGDNMHAMKNEMSDVYNGELEVEVWINSIVGADSTTRDDVTSESARNADLPLSATTIDVILHLKGDYFTFYISNTSSEGITAKVEKRCHTSYLHCELQRRIENSVECEDVLYLQSTEGNYGQNASQAVDYSIGTLVQRYCKQAAKLLRFRDSILEKVHLISHGSPDKQSTLQNVLSTQEDNLHLQKKLALQRRLYSDAPTSHTVNFTAADGTAFSADVKQCFTPEEVATYSFSLLHIPLNPAIEYDIESTRNSIVQHIAAENRAYPCDCATQLSAVFPDLTRMKFDPSTQIFNVMLATGKECSFSLCSYKRSEGIFASQTYIPVVDNSFHRDPVHGQRNTGAFPMHGINCRRPAQEDFNVPQITFYVKKLLAFHRYASTRPEHRAALLEADRRALAVARAASLQCHQKEMINAVAKGALTPEAASMRTKAFVASMGHSAKSPMARPPITVTPDRQVPTSHRSPYGYATPSPMQRGQVAVVSGGTTIGVSRVHTGSQHSRGSAMDSREYSSLTYSHPSSASHQHTPPASFAQHGQHGPGQVHYPRRVNVVTPPSVPHGHALSHSPHHLQDPHHEIHRTADAMAGKYLYQNVSISSLHNSFGAAPPAPPVRAAVPVTPEALDVDAVNKRARKLCDEMKNIHIPHSRENLPNYKPELNAPMAKYLGQTYVNDMLEQSAKVYAKNKAYLQQFQQTA